MKRIVLSLAIGLLSCSKTAVGPEDPGPLKGWRSAGLASSSEGSGTDRFEWMSVSGTDLFVMNGQGEVFQGAQGRADWIRVAIPQQESVACIRAYPGHLLVGTAETGRILRLDLASRSWDSLPIRLNLPSSVNALGWHEGRLVVFASKQDSGQRIRLLDTATLAQEDWSWGFPRYYAMIHSFLSYEGAFYAATYSDGLWKRAVGDSVWSETVRPLDTVTGNRLKMPRGLAIHRDSLWMGQLAGSIYRTKDGFSWTEVDNCPITAPCLDAPYSAFALLSYRDRLFAAGYAHASPVEWDPDSSKWVPILNETWCREVGGKTECGGAYTFDMAAIGDTLYACGSARIMKMPLSDLPPRGHWTP